MSTKVGGNAPNKGKNPPTNKNSHKKSQYPTSTAVVPQSKPMSFIEDTFEDDDGNIVDIDTSVQQIGVAKTKKKVKGGGFQAMDLAPQVFEGIKSMGFNIPTPIQRQAIPIMLEGADVVAMARTGSGKTAAFTIPMLHRLATNKPLLSAGQGSTRGVRAVVLSPTRELAQQTHQVICKIGKQLNYRIIMLIGGQALSTQFELLSNSPDIIVATPGRLVHHLIEVQFSLQSVEFVCFDEADRLFEMGFAQQLYEILKRMNDNRQTCLFSATMPQALIEFSRAGLKSPVSVRLDSESKLSPDLEVSFFHVKSKEKNAALLFILRSVLPKEQQAIVFVATRHHVDFLVLLLQHAGISSTGIYGQMDADGRIENIDLFKRKKSRVLVVTDLAARGIDIPLLDNVIHYDFPTQPKLFIHRSGRVARAGQKGTAFTLVSPDDMPYLIDLYLFFAWKLPFIQQTINKSALKPKDDGDKVKTMGDDDNNKTSTALIDPKNKNNNTSSDDSDDDNDNRLEDKEPEMDRLVEFGLIPTSLLDFEVEHANSVILNNDLERLVIGCDNAYEKYSTSKGSASRASMQKWRAIRGINIKSVIDIHPWFSRQADTTNIQTTTTINPDGTISTKTTNVVHNPNSFKSMIQAEKAKELLSNYAPQQTIFELNNKDEIIRQKRLMHDRVIVNKHGLKEVVGQRLAAEWEEEQQLLAEIEAQENDAEPAFSNKHTIVVKVKDDLQQGSKVTVTAADRRKRKNLNEKYKFGKITMNDYISGLRDLPTQLQQNPVDQDPSVVVKTNANLSKNGTNLTGNTNNNTNLTMSRPKDGPPVIDFSAGISRGDRPPTLMMAGILPKGPTKRGASELDKPTPETTSTRAEILKRLAESVSDELNITQNGNSDDITQPRKKKRGQLTAEERKDSNYISLAPSGNRYEELGLSIGNSRLEDLSLELNAEDGEGRRIQQKTRKWSETSKKFVTIYSTKDAFGKVVTNEAGQKVNKDYVPGQLYAEWRSKNRKLEQIVDLEGDEDAKQRNSKDKRRRPPRGGFKSIDEDTSDKTTRKFGHNNKGGHKLGRDSRGKVKSDGVFTATELIKQKRKDENNKLKAQKDAFAKKKAMGAKKGGKGGGRP